MKKRVLVVANPGAGTAFVTDKHLVEVLQRHELEFDMRLVATPQDVYDAVDKASPKRYVAIVVFGGDGTVIAAVKAAIRKDMPVLPLPGGSANVFAKNAGIPGDIERSIAAYAAGAYVTRRLPVATAGNELLVLELHFGVFAQSVRSTPVLAKRWVGDKAYYLNALLHMPKAVKHLYKLSMDGRDFDKNAYACFIVNTGNIEFMRARALPRPKPGYLRVLTVHSRNLFTLLQWLLLKQLTGRNLNKALSVTYAKEVVVHKAPKMMNYDDNKQKAELPLVVKADACHASIIVPIVRRKGSTRLFANLRNAYYRATDQLWRHYSGIPSERFSRVDKQLFLGGQYGLRGAEALASRGVTGIISMRTFVPLPIENHPDIEILHLPTVDETAPTVENLKQGIAFANRHIASGGSVYVHCRLGEGRGPTMAAAYLISQGLKVEDALVHLRHYRPFAKPNKEQVAALRQLAKIIQQ